MVAQGFPGFPRDQLVLTTVDQIMDTPAIAYVSVPAVLVPAGFVLTSTAGFADTAFYL